MYSFADRPVPAVTLHLANRSERLTPDAGYHDPRHDVDEPCGRAQEAERAKGGQMRQVERELNLDTRTRRHATRAFDRMQRAECLGQTHLAVCKHLVGDRRALVREQ